jgi:hypothetical protein
MIQAILIDMKPSILDVLFRRFTKCALKMYFRTVIEEFDHLITKAVEERLQNEESYILPV